VRTARGSVQQHILSEPSSPKQSKATRTPGAPDRFSCMRPASQKHFTSEGCSRRCTDICLLSILKGGVPSRKADAVGHMRRYRVCCDTALTKKPSLCHVFELWLSDSFSESALNFPIAATCTFATPD